ncbi:hypothetical protein BDK51DRAFT_27581, partial [Blyttiomyces helicus]
FNVQEGTVEPLRFYVKNVSGKISIQPEFWGGPLDEAKSMHRMDDAWTEYSEDFRLGPLDDVSECVRNNLHSEDFQVGPVDDASECVGISLCNEDFQVGPPNDASELRIFKKVPLHVNV